MGVIGVTGSNGFIGKFFCKLLEQKKIRCVCFEGNLLNHSHIERFINAYHPDQIVHLAGTFDPPFENQLNKNVLTTQSILQYGVPRGVKRIILSSSGAVYGEPVRTASRETDPLLPNTLYGLSKMYAEECVQYYARTYGTKYVILRFPSVYGDGNTKGVLYNFLKDIRKNKNITIAGDGNQRRNFLHVDDACAALIKALEYTDSGIFNISNPTIISIQDVVTLLHAQYNFSVSYKKQDNNLMNLLLDVKKARRELQFYPKVTSLHI